MPNVRQMFFPGFAVDQYVIEEHQNKVPKVSAKYIIHKSLESRGSIAQTEWHDQEFKMTVVSSECHFFQCRLDACVPDDIPIANLVW